MDTGPAWTTIDEYIATFPPEVADRLTQLRNTIAAAAPEATEKISYQMPTFYLNGNLIHFAGYARHIGLYPTPSGTQAFEAELAAYPRGKGSVQFPHDRPLPLDLVDRIVRFRAADNRAKPGKKSRDN